MRVARRRLRQSQYAPPQIARVTSTPTMPPAMLPLFSFVALALDDGSHPEADALEMEVLLVALKGRGA